MSTPNEILNRYWGFSSFRKPQQEIIKAALSEADLVVLLPTGGGKSICFQIPALLKKGVCLVISPLIALIQDQINTLNRKGIKATTIESGSSENQIIELFDIISSQNYKFLYLSPERLQSKLVQEKIKQLEVCSIAIDEAHCISEWGHDFRPSYLNINILRQIKPEVNFIALTASATPKVLDDIISILNLERVKIFRKSFFRENLAYQIFNSEDKLYRIRQIFTKTKSPAIVYVNTRRKTVEISRYLTSNGFKSSFYHGGLSVFEKKKAFESWMEEKTPIMVATNAFGMGIDKPNIGIVVHFDLPNSLENYMQEAGRAGRNGKKAFAVMFKNKADITSFSRMTQESLPNLREIKMVHRKLYQHFGIATAEFTERGFAFSLPYFCSEYQLNSKKTYNALKILQSNGVIELDDSFQKKATVKFLTDSSQVLNYTRNRTKKREFIETLFRSYSGLFERPVKIDEFYLAKKAQITSQMVVEYLDSLAANNYIEYKKGNSLSRLYFLIPREDDRTINRISKNIQSYLDQKREKASDLLSFINNDSLCRNIQILLYFGEKNASKCGICDVCLGKKYLKNRDISKKIIKILGQSDRSSREICEILKIRESVILINLEQLMAEKKILINSNNNYFLIDNL